jgi:hypothetical protein
LGKAYFLKNDPKVLLNEFIESSEKDIQILKTVKIMGGTQKPTVRLEKDLSLELKKLKELFDEGIITQQEFETEKKELLEKY